MREISCKITGQLLDGAEWLGLDPAEIARALGRSAQELRDPKGWVAWETLVALIDELCGRGVTKGQFEELGRQTINFPSSAFLRRLARQVVGVRQLYVILFRWLAPSLFPVIAIRMDDLSRSTVQFRLEIPDGYPGCEPFFWVVSSIAGVVPSLVGAHEVEVEAAVDDRSCELRVVLPAEESLPARLVQSVQDTLFPSRLLTELGEHQEALRRSYDELFRSRRDLTQVLERTPVGIAVCRRDTILFANSELAKLVGCSDSRDLIGRPLDELVAVEPDQVAATPSLVEGALDGPMHVSLQRADQSVAAAELSGGGEILFDGAAAHLLMVRDISVQQQLEENLRRADRLASLGRIAANIAHEVNNPLGYMILNLQRVRRRWLRAAVPDEADGVAALDAIEEGAKRIEEIVRELTSLAPHEGEQSVPIDAHTVLDQTIEMTARLLPDGARVEREYSGEAFVTAQPRHLQQVLINLLSNGAQALPPLAGAPGRLVVRTGNGDGDLVHIEVEDNGEGIADEHRERIFKPFFSTKDSGEHTGLGLAICQDLLARMGGRLSFETTPGKGTVFRVELPRAPSAIAVAGDRAEPAPARSERHSPAGQP
ncbi:MAG: PAS domain-containing protein [Deltaproteobacteria bacterium]|jgi:signal transduction histidine kinase|nr:PAS domain-containing protein [Deltaproteobacteria bacterium]MBW2531895.1 PAS domain-containing protein [Deltaproteobacteria bacterium]